MSLFHPSHQRETFLYLRHRSRCGRMYQSQLSRQRIRPLRREQPVPASARNGNPRSLQCRGSCSLQVAVLTPISIWSAMNIYKLWSRGFQRYRGWNSSLPIWRMPFSGLKCPQSIQTHTQQRHGSGSTFHGFLHTRQYGVVHSLSGWMSSACLPSFIFCQTPTRSISLQGSSKNSRGDITRNTLLGSSGMKSPKS